MSANMITVIRIVLAFLTVFLFGRGYQLAFLAFFLTIIVIYMDALDGWIARGFLTDTVRSVAFAEGKTPFGEKTMMRTGVKKLLVSSRFSRGLHGVLKSVVFCWLGFLVAMNKGIATGAISQHQKFMAVNELIVSALVWVVFLMCIIRGLPVLWDGRAYVLDKRFPKVL